MNDKRLLFLVYDDVLSKINANHVFLLKVKIKPLILRIEKEMMGLRIMNI